MQRFGAVFAEVDELTGSRVALRPWRSGDAAMLQEAIEASRAHLRPWMPFADEHQTVEESRDWVTRSEAHRLAGESLNMGIWDREGERLLGGIGARVCDARVPSFEIGYWLRASEEGRGYMTEATRLMTAYLFETIAARRVQILCDARNTHSAAVPLRLGYIQEGRLRHEVLAVDGSLEETLIFGITRDEWRGANGAASA